MQFIMAKNEKCQFIYNRTVQTTNVINMKCSSINRDPRDSPADSGLDLDLRCIENVLTDYDSQHLQTSETG